MSCERIREQIPEVLAGRLDKAAREQLVEHLEGCAGCRAEVAELNAVWRGMENLKAEPDDAPQSAAKARFQEVLAAYRAGMEAAQAPAASKVVTFPSRRVWQAAIAAGLLALGIFAGRSFAPAGGTGNGEMAQLRGQVEGLRQMVALSMLQGQSPSARMRGVTYSEQISQPDKQVLDALLQAVNHDSNVNVRLSAVDALQKFSADPALTQAMVDAIPAQDTPLVQIALIDMLVQLNARGAAGDLARFAKDQRFDEMVRQRAAWALHKMEAER
ncbi:MAG: anti-ECFsigma factor, ChrR [Candidatus Solibacter sp.]|nr:anti-ECFsigma factor, ChrR [Candidatus Solibacter sp.]